ncbi:hypothetical protein NDU88_002105 [Pleurodeles waltl]|uniref:Uncharacterized protein n=1 Tax=Pleurodeles waltl TaxID=8319 RepID=A0AAV7UUR1_PLEWA|nr:hypothetical protein NDU88_002105 [Pleurodeles waltl]
MEPVIQRVIGEEHLQSQSRLRLAGDGPRSGGSPSGPHCRGIRCVAEAATYKRVSALRSLPLRGRSILFLYPFSSPPPLSFNRHGAACRYERSIALVPCFPQRVLRASLSDSYRLPVVAALFGLSARGQ